VEDDMRIRTGYSFKTAVGHVDEVLDRIKAIGWKVAPISDRMSTFGFVNWTKEARKRDLRPIYGVELPVVAELGVKKPTIDWWSFFAIKDLVHLNQAVELATTNGGLTYSQAEALPGLIKLTGERTLLSHVTKRAKDLYVSLSPSTPKGLYNEAVKRKLPLLATGDNVYTSPDDAEFYRVALGFRASTQTYPQHIVDDDELRRSLWFASSSSQKMAFAARGKVIVQCSATLGVATLLDPHSKTSLRDLCLAGGERLSIDLADPVYAERLERELRLIAEKDYEDYFFIIADLMQWSRNHMVVGPARGSSCGSLVCYLLGITSIDPIPHKLIFERFIDTTRSDLPDIDLDFSDERRHLAMEYLSKKYGQDHSARLGSVNMWQAKSALNALGPALRIPQWQINEVGNTVIKRSFGDSRSDSTVIDTLNGTAVGRRMLQEFPAAVLADRMEDHPASAGQHAAGMVLTDKPVINYVAIDGRTGAVMCNKYDAETLNLLKVDMLGLTQLSVFERTLELIGEEPRNRFLEAIPLNDQLAFDVLNRLMFSGVFQFQYPGSALQTLMQRFIKNEKGRVTEFEDIVSFTALVRPGPLGSGATDVWMRRRAGNERVTYPHPVLEPYLRDTLGIITYQEQVMQIGKDIGDLTWEDVTALRKAMSKSLGKEYFNQFGDRWKAGARIKLTGMQGYQIDQFWDDLCTYGMWAFNRSHSVAYAMVTYWSCWLKAHHPVEYAAATLDAEADPGKQVVVLREMRDEGVDYIPIDPEVSSDKWAIKIEGGNRRKLLVGPLTNIRGVGPATVRDILDARRAGEELRPALAKRLANAQTAIASLSPISDEVARLHPKLDRIGVITKNTPIGEIQGGTEVLVLGVMTKVAPLNENEPARVARRRGKVYDGPIEALNMFIKDDTGEIFCKIDRFDFERIGRPVVAQAKRGKSLYAIKGWVPPDFRMVRISQIRYLGDFGSKGPGPG
jgi:DNA polymerase III alpha subunit